MPRVVWLTDLHLNFVKREATAKFLDSVAAAGPDALLLGGDIAEARDVIDYLAQLATRLPCPIYLVLGNHDFYFGSIREIRARVTDLCQAMPNLVYLTGADARELTPTVGLLGHDGWADCRLGDYERSLVMMNDYRLIRELAGLSKAERWPVLKAMGDEAADDIRRLLPSAVDHYPHVFLLTHVPPFREACWHAGRISDDEWLPHFTCQAMGEALIEVMGSRPDRRLTVLCGHTHGQGECRPLENIHVLTGGAEYGLPEIQRVFEIA